jgi:hypothetical protein
MTFTVRLTGSRKVSASIFEKQVTHDRHDGEPHYGVSLE